MLQSFCIWRNNMYMKNNKILIATDQELYEHWLKCEYDNIISFSEYKDIVTDAGVEIVKERIQCVDF